MYPRCTRVYTTHTRYLCLLVHTCTHVCILYKILETICTHVRAYLFVQCDVPEVRVFVR